ncbi:acyl carrier protein [Paenibacillus sp. GCM10012306]|uniref:acyl carrier protein n=1 Tax=Paenibacillus sp. GCM10012306 TaxID=3317342 RepID=UPI00360EEC0D
MSKAEIELKVVNFLKRCTKKESIDYSKNFQEMGIVNSLLLMQLILFIEKEFELTVSNDDLRNNTLSSIDNIIAYVEGRNNSVTN